MAYNIDYLRVGQSEEIKREIDILAENITGDSLTQISPSKITMLRDKFN